MARSTAAVSVEKYVRIARAGGKDDNAPLLEVTQRAAPDIRLGDFFHADRRHDPRVETLFLEDVLDGKGVDDGAEHAHVIGGDAFDADLGERASAHDVATTDHEANRRTRFHHRADFVRDALDGREIECGSLLSGERLAGELQKDARIREISDARCAAGIRAPSHSIRNF